MACSENDVVHTHHVTPSCLCMLFQSFSPRSSLCYSFAFTLFWEAILYFFYLSETLIIVIVVWISHISMSSLIPLFIISFPVVYGVQERISLCFTEEGMFSFIFLSILRCPFVSEILLECNSDFRFHHSTEHLPIKPNCLFCLKKKVLK